MSRADLTNLLERGAGPAPHEVDTTAVWRRGRRRRSMKRVTAAAGVAAVVAAVVAVQPFSGGATRGISIAPADRPSTTEPTDVVVVDDSEVVPLAAVPTDHDSLKDAVVANGDGLRGLWQMADIDGEAPTLPDGTVGLFVIARHAKSTCRSTSDVTGVEIDNGVAVVLLDPDGEFLRPCPGPQGSGAWTAFAVAIPDHYDQGLTRATSRLATADNPRADTTGEAAGGEAPDIGPYVTEAQTDPTKMRAEPGAVAPGNELQVAFPQGTIRSPGFVLEQETGQGWEWRWAIHSEPDAPDMVNVFTAAEFVARDIVWQSGPAFESTAPHLIPVPDGVEAGRWRICTALETPALCAEFEVTAERS